MMSIKKRYFWQGVISTLIVALFLFLTLFFPEFFIKYAGVLTLYSLLGIFAIFLLDRSIGKRDKRNSDLGFLRYILRASRLIKNDLENYHKFLSEGRIPLNIIGQFGLAIPLEIGSRSTSKLYESLIYANTKIEIINNWTQENIEIFYEPNEKERNKLLNQFNIVWGENLKIAMDELETTIQRIKEELSNWIKFQD